MAVDVRAALEREVETCLADALPEVDLLEVSIVGRGDGAKVRAVVDHAAGVDHSLCERVTRAMQAVGIGDRYGIEVWSPGPEPPLRTREHFRRAIGHRVALRVTDGDRVRSREGLLSAVDDRHISITMPTGVVDIPRDAIRRARDLDGGERW